MQDLTKRVKSVLRPLVPVRLLDARRRAQFEREQAAVRGKPLQDVFTDIYETGAWHKDGSRYHSGPGSAPGVTEGYEHFVSNYLERNPSVRTIVDIGCGDFQVSGRILAKISRPVTYIGCDIAPNLITYNQQQHGIPGQIEFRHLDASRDLPPAGDIVTVREVLQHLSNATISAVLANLRQRFEKAIISESLFMTPTAPNLDIESGYRTRDGLRSGVYLDQPPYSLDVIDRFETRVSDDEIIRTLLVRL